MSNRRGTHGHPPDSEWTSTGFDRDLPGGGFLHLWQAQAQYTVGQLSVDILLVDDLPESELTVVLTGLELHHQLIFILVVRRCGHTAQG